MKDKIKKIAKRVLTFIVNLIGFTPAGRYFEASIINAARKRVVHVSHEGISLRFSAPNALSRFRYETFSSKEPETLEWINHLPSGAILWDIGANVGLYSIYAAKKRECKVWAFEPSIFNL